MIKLLFWQSHIRPSGYAPLSTKSRILIFTFYYHIMIYKLENQKKAVSIEKIDFYILY